MKTGQPVGTFVTSKDKFFDRVISLTYSPDGRSLASGTVGYDVALWDTATGERRTIRAKRDSICDLAFTPDGSQIAVCTHYESVVWLHALESGELSGTFEGHVNSVAALAYSARRFACNRRDGWFRRSLGCATTAASSFLASDAG